MARVVGVSKGEHGEDVRLREVIPDVALVAPHEGEAPGDDDPLTSDPVKKLVRTAMMVMIK